MRRERIKEALLQRGRILEHRQRQCDRDLALHHVTDHLLDRCAVDIERSELRSGPVRAVIRLLAWVKLSVNHEPMLEVVDAKRGRFAKADRTMVSGDFMRLAFAGTCTDAAGPTACMRPPLTTIV